MHWSLRRLLCPEVATVSLAGLLVGGLLVGFEPVGGDPDRLYRPLKEEFIHFLARGQLPFWSDRFGLGIPLLAESHVAAFYPANWLIYSIAGISTAYRMAMWLHYLLLAAATFAYARFLRISPNGAAIAALAFTFCGFQAIHSTHEPFYHALPYLTLATLITEWYLRNGRLLGIILLAIAWGAQLTLGHFQLQLWTAALVLLLGTWRVVRDRRPWHRVLGLVLALVWGAALASVQLGSSWELARFVGFTHRSFSELAFFAFPPAHWAELAIPGWLRNSGWSGGALLVRAGNLGLRGVLLHRHDATAFGVCLGRRRQARWPPGSLALHHRPELDPGGAATNLAGGVFGGARSPGFGLVPRTGTIPRAVHSWPLSGRGRGARPGGSAGLDPAGHGHGLGFCFNGRGLGGLLVDPARSPCRARRLSIGSRHRSRRAILGGEQSALARLATGTRPGLSAHTGHGRGAWLALLHLDHRLGMGH